MNKRKTTFIEFAITLVAVATLQACGGNASPRDLEGVNGANVSVTASTSASDFTSGLTTSTASKSGSADESAESTPFRVQALSVSRATECATVAGSTCLAASPILDTSPASWVLSKTGAGTVGAIDQAQGLVSARSLAINYQFSCTSSNTVECARVSATTTPASSVATANSLSLSIKAPLNADIRVEVVDTNAQHFTYSAARSASAAAGTWSQVVIDLSKPLSSSGLSGAGKLGAMARSVSISSVAPASGSSSGWLEIDGIQFFNPVATLASAVTAVTAAASATIAVGAVTAPLVTADSPIVFNASDSARPGDVVTLQGANFGTAPQVMLQDGNGSNLQVLKVVNTVGTHWLAAEIPSTAAGALMLRVVNGPLSSAPIRLNGAVPHHLDAMTITPGGIFRVFGRNLALSGSTPSVRVDGVVANVNLSSSDETMLTVQAPALLAATATSVITVDNGNGTGPATLDRNIAVQTGQSGDRFGLSVGWAAGFSAFASRIIDATNDAHLSAKVVCNGSQDDAPAIQAAIDYVASSSGGVVQLPSGVCRMSSGVALRSNTVLQGAGKTSTTLRYEGVYPLFGMNIDLAGVRNLGFVNAGAVQEGPLLKNSTRIFMQNVRIDLQTSKQMFLTDNVNMVVSGSDFIQGGSINGNGPYVFDGSSGLIFTGNTTTWVAGSNSFGRTHDSVMAGNTFTRDGSAQNFSAGTVHAFTMDFAYRIAVIGNTFNVKNGPITNVTRNDGETLLTEGGGASRTENVGTVTAATINSFTDTGSTLAVNPFSTGTIPEDYGVAIVSGKGAGQHRRLVSYANGKVVVDRNWDVVPEVGSRYASFVWGLEKSMLKGNMLSQNPRGIWLYQTSIRDVAVLGNSISEGGGIYLRSYQNLANKIFQPMFNVRIAGNTVKNTTRNWSSYINAIFVDNGSEAYGTAMQGIEIRDNQIVANQPNLSSQTEEYAGIDGFMNMTRFEGGNYESSVASPRILGTILQRNGCANCDVGFRLGTGDTGLVLWSNALINSAALFVDWATGPTTEASVGTVTR